MSLSIQLPDNLEQQLTIYCQQHHLSKNETIRLALERLLSMANKPLTHYELGKDGFGSDQTHEGDIAQQTKDLLKARSSYSPFEKEDLKQIYLIKSPLTLFVKEGD